MTSHRSSSRAPLRLLSALIGVFGAASSAALAQDGRWVTPDGRKYDLSRSRTELAVKMRSCEPQDDCATRLEAEGFGKLQPFKRAPFAEYKVLEGTRTDKASVERLSRDPAIEEVQNIYRFAGSDSLLVGTKTIVVKIQRGMTLDQSRALWRDFGIVEAVAVEGQPFVYTVGVPDGEDELHLAEALADDPRTQWAQPNFRREIEKHQLNIADQYFSQQWHLNNTGQLGGTAGADIDAPEAWAIATGNGVIVGLFDDAVDVDHEDLRDNYIGTGQDVTLAPTADGADDPRPKRSEFFGVNRHGTATMGVMVARANNRGGRGVAFNARFTASRGLKNLPTDGQIASAFIFARNQDVDVHNNSWSMGSTPDPAVIADALAVTFATGRNLGDLDGDGDDDPLGMPIFFSAGNAPFAFEEGTYLAALPFVMAIGASTDRDQRWEESSFGPTMSVLAPASGGAAQIFTTDNADTSDIDQGYNIGEIAGLLGEIDQTGNYTRRFGGTSASSPIAAGVAALMLSANPNLTATDVRLVIEHTADRIEPLVAQYDTITSRSQTHGYGRINAGGAGEKIGAVEAAQQALSNGGHTWPDRALDLQVGASTVEWIQGSDTSEFLVVQSNNPFGFIPADGSCYDPAQSNCTSDLRSLPAGVSVLAVGCGLDCGSNSGACELGAPQCVTLPQGKFMAVYARNTIGRYSFGVAFDSAGNVEGAGRFVDLTAIDEVAIPTGPPASRPEVTISVTPKEGQSPLTVNFRGNALSSVPIDETRTAWDFDRGTPPDVDAVSRNASNVYEAPDGQTRVFVARLTMYDTNGTPGSAEIAITVHGKGQGSGGGGSGGSGSARIIVGLPSTPDSDVSGGRSPFSVVLSVDASSLTGTLQGISWDLGDGARSNGLTVPHTYINEGTTSIRIPITATITTVTSPTTTINTVATRFITVDPGDPSSGSGDPGECELPGTCAGGPGGSANPCGFGALLPVTFILLTLTLVRRRGR